ncbi:MAG: hypothetical protein GY718_10725 [Lentisphaerae bacterium]|nr:hypothetical protein [Lentisphaerota bacterium]
MNKLKFQLENKTKLGKDQAKAQFESVEEMVTELMAAGETEDYRRQEEAEETIRNDALSVEIRTGWYCVGSEDNEPAEYAILLCTGGPAVRIRGELGHHGGPESARIEHQDWFTPWTEYALTEDQEGILLTYANQFYYGEG